MTPPDAPEREPSQAHPTPPTLLTTEQMVSILWTERTANQQKASRMTWIEGGFMLFVLGLLVTLVGKAGGLDSTVERAGKDLAAVTTLAQGNDNRLGKVETRLDGLSQQMTDGFKRIDERFVEAEKHEVERFEALKVLLQAAPKGRQ